MIDGVISLFLNLIEILYNTITYYDGFFYTGGINKTSSYGDYNNNNTNIAL